MTFVLKIGVNHHMPLWLSQLPQRTFSSLSSLPDHGWESLTPILITRRGWSELCSFLFPQFNSLSRIWLFVTPWTAASQVSLSIATPGAYSNSCPSSQWYHPTISSSIVPFSSCLQSFPNQCPFQWVTSLHQVAKILEFQHQSSQRIFRTDIFRIDCLNLLAVQWTLKSLLQHNSSKASILQCSDFFTVQLSHPYMTTGKTIALTKQIFVGKVMSLFNMLSRWAIAFLLFIFWFHGYNHLQWFWSPTK